MRTLVIMRHAKAERGHGMADFDRALEPRGLSEADVVGAKLADLGIAPDVVLCSSSRRTRDTLGAVLPHMPGDAVVHILRKLYDAEVADLRAAVDAASGTCVLLIGHNPSVHGLAEALAAGSADAGQLKHGFPTSTAAVFKLGGTQGSDRLERVISP